MNTNIASWFEIPVTDLDRAKKFYTAVFNVQFMDAEMHGSKMAMFPWIPNAAHAAGCLVQSEGRKPAPEGCSVYLQCEDLNDELSRVENNGGKVLTPKFSLGDFGGFAAHILDSEGNRVGLSSAK